MTLIRYKSGRLFEIWTQNLDKIVIGQILSIERHPDADKLVICQVNIGREDRFRSLPALLTYHVGDKVPVVLDGGRVAGGHDGKKTPKAASRSKKENSAASSPTV